MDSSSPDKRTAKSRLEHIAIHEDAIILAQCKPAASELEEALSSLEAPSRRKPLGEIDVRIIQECSPARNDSHDDQGEAAQLIFSSHLDTTSPPRHTLPSPRSNHEIRAYKKDTHLKDEQCSEKPTSQTLTGSTYESSVVVVDRQLVALTPDQRSTKSIIELSVRQQGQGEHHNKQQSPVFRGTPATPITKYSKSLAAMATPASRRTVSNKENWTPSHEPITPIRDNYDALEAAVVEAATPGTPNSRPQSSGQLLPTTEQKQTIVGLKAREFEVDKKSAIESTAIVDKIDSVDTAALPGPTTTSEAPKSELPLITPQEESPQSVVYKPADSRTTTPSPENTTITKPGIASLKGTPVVRTTKAAQARIQLAHGPKTTKTAAWGPPRQSLSGHNRTSSLRQSFGPTMRITSGGSASSASSEDEKKETLIPHSKPRPMSMAFPMPPPPPKGRAPTKSTFVLPGEIVAAKLKAAREEREQKDDSVKQFKARPVPAFIKNAPTVRQTNTSRARESIGGRDMVLRLQSDMPHRRASSVAAMRLPENKSPANSRPTSRDKPLVTAVVKPIDIERPATSLANISKPRSASPAPAAIAPSGMSKGREVFTRNVFANAAAEREKRAKEEAQRKARVEAAERSRQLSREWAEKKRREALEAKTQVKV